MSVKVIARQRVVAWQGQQDTDTDKLMLPLTAKCVQLRVSQSNYNGDEDLQFRSLIYHRQQPTEKHFPEVLHNVPVTNAQQQPTKYKHAVSDSGTEKSRPLYSAASLGRLTSHPLTRTYKVRHPLEHNTSYSSTPYPPQLTHSRTQYKHHPPTHQ